MFSRLNCLCNRDVDVTVDSGSDHRQVVQSNAVKLIVAVSRLAFCLATKSHYFLFCIVLDIA